MSDDVHALTGVYALDALPAVHCAVPTNLPGVPGVVTVAHEVGLPVIAAGRGFGIDDHRALRLGCDGWAPDAVAGARLAEAWLDAPPPLGGGSGDAPRRRAHRAP